MGTLAGAFDGMSNSDACIYPPEKRSYLLESSLPKMLRSGSSRFRSTRQSPCHGDKSSGQDRYSLDALKARPE
jgi:hypothetical protein